MKPISILLALCAWLMVPLPSQAAESLRCGSRLASVGMTAAEVLSVCGAPSDRDVWAPPGSSGSGYLGAVEAWTYNFGSSQLLRILRFRQGRLQRIDTDGYGFAVGAPGDCAQRGMTRGMSKYRLIAQCGEPVTKVADVVQAPADRPERIYDPRHAYNSWEIVYREEWVYNFGRGRLMRIVHLDNGRVTDVEFGERGYNAD